MGGSMKSVEFKEYKLSYFVFGTAGEQVLCFHGHGRSGKDYLFLAERGVQIIAVNLFFHEDSNLPNSKPLNWRIVNTLLKLILHKEDVAHFHGLAYSQGGRFALKFFENNHQLFKSLTLLAPDGLNDKSLYSWSSRRLFFQTIFIGMSKKPESIQMLTKFVSKTGFMRAKVRDFVYKFTEDKEAMQRAARAWSAFSSIRPNVKKIGLLLREQNIPFKLIMGSHDQIIRPIQGEHFLKEARLDIKLIVIPTGHNFFKEDTMSFLLPELSFLPENSKKDL
jgi:pimeloyl-ACP methyl ester carboxylesterase